MVAWQVRNKHVLVVGGGEVCLHLTMTYLPAVYIVAKQGS